MQWSDIASIYWWVENYPNCSWVCSVPGRWPFHHPQYRTSFIASTLCGARAHRSRLLLGPVLAVSTGSKVRPLLELECEECGLAPTGKVRPEKRLWKITSCPQSKEVDSLVEECFGFSAMRLHLPIAIPTPQPFSSHCGSCSSSSLLWCVLAYGSWYLCFHSCPAPYPLSCVPPPLPAPACSTSQLCFCRVPPSCCFAFLVQRPSLHPAASMRARQPYCYLKMLTLGASSLSSKAESLSDLTKQGNKPVRLISIWSIF